MNILDYMPCEQCEEDIHHTMWSPEDQGLCEKCRIDKDEQEEEEDIFKEAQKQAKQNYRKDPAKNQTAKNANMRKKQVKR